MLTRTTCAQCKFFTPSQTGISGKCNYQMGDLVRACDAACTAQIPAKN